MDFSRQPGILFKNIILAKEEFFRENDVPEDAKLRLNFSLNSAINDISKDSYLEINTEVTLCDNEKDVLKLNMLHVGIFSVEPGNENMDLEDFFKYNAPALMLPYIREHVTHITLKAGINPIILPPLNIIAMTNKQDKLESEIEV